MGEPEIKGLSVCSTDCDTSGVIELYADSEAYGEFDTTDESEFKGEPEL